MVFLTSTYSYSTTRCNVFWVPGWLYEKLPLVYVVAGIVLVALFGFAGPGALSSTLLFAAAVLTYNWRRRKRRAKAIARRQ